MQETLEDIHTEEDRGGDGKPNSASQEHHDTAGDEAHVGGDRTEHGFLEEDEGELLMRQGQGPETEVGGGVGDGSEDVFDGFDGLMDEDLTGVVFFVVVVVVVVEGLGLEVGDFTSGRLFADSIDKNQQSDAGKAKLQICMEEVLGWGSGLS